MSHRVQDRRRIFSISKNCVSSEIADGIILCQTSIVGKRASVPLLLRLYNNAADWQIERKEYKKKKK